MSLFTYPLIGYALTHSTSRAALAGAAFALGGAVFGCPRARWWTAGTGKTVMVASEGAGAVIYASLAVAGLLHVLTLPHLVVAAFLTGAAGTFYDPGGDCGDPHGVPAEQLPTAFSQNQARQHLASLLGPPVGGALYALARLLPFVFDALTYTVSTLALTQLRTPLPAPVVTGGDHDPLRHRRGHAVHALARLPACGRRLRCAGERRLQRAVPRHRPQASPGGRGACRDRRRLGHRGGRRGSAGRSSPLS